jgi:hypothetical protein
MPQGVRTLDEPRKRSKRDLWRWIFALLVFVGATFALVVGWFETCTIKTVGDRVEQTCSTPSITDASIAFLALIGVLLLWPDLQEIGALGISLKKRIEATQKQADQLENRFLIQEALMQNISQSVSNVNTVRNQITISSEKLSYLQQELPDKQRAFLERDKPTVMRAVGGEIDAELAIKLLGNWELLSRALSVSVPQYRREESGIDGIARYVEFAAQFKQTFSEELEIIRAARNAIAHSDPISAEELERAVAISDDLLATLSQGQQWSEPAE